MVQTYFSTFVSSNYSLKKMNEILKKYNLNNDFKEEVPMYLNNKNIFNSLSNLKLIKGDYLSNLLICYKCLIKNGYISKKELIYLRSWISDIKNLK